MFKANPTVAERFVSLMVADKLAGRRWADAYPAQVEKVARRSPNPDRERRVVHELRRVSPEVARIWSGASPTPPPKCDCGRVAYQNGLCRPCYVSRTKR